MVEIVARLSTIRAVSLATIILLLLFLLLTLYRAYPLIDNVNAATSTGDCDRGESPKCCFELKDSE